MALVFLLFYTVSSVAAAPSITLSPTGGASGSDLAVVPGGFTPQYPGQVLWDGSKVSTFTSIPTTIKLTVPSDAAAGPYTIRVCVNCGGGEFEESAHAVFTVALPDMDKDGFPDDIDNCPAVYNKDQVDMDKDGIGDICDKCDDRDDDGDGIKNCDDICPDEAETLNDYQDTDGCPDSAPPSDIDGDGVPDLEDNCPTVSNQDQTDTDLDGTGDACDKASAPYKGGVASKIRITVTKSPPDPSIGDRVNITVEAVDPAGISLIEIYVDGVQMARCPDRMVCTATTPPITSSGGPSLGSRVFNGEGSLGTEGVIPPLAESPTREWWFRDNDEDSVPNVIDNCVDTPNTDQTDSDVDGVGDACDLCDAISACGGVHFAPAGPSYTCEASTRGIFDRYDSRLYDLIDRNGCGCFDEDGRDFLRRGSAYVEGTPATTVQNFMGRDVCLTSSDCEVRATDNCINSRQLEEFYCGPDGPVSVTIECPEGCSDGACNNPDTDGGVNYYERGTVAGRTDQCTTYGSNVLVEHSPGFDEDNTFIVNTENFECPFGCSDGACLCEDTDAGRNYTVQGSMGDSEDYCSNDRTLMEYYPNLRGNDCSAAWEHHACEGLCSDGACQPPTCSDGIRNQGEEGIDSGGPCAPAGYVRVSGYLEYEEADALNGSATVRGPITPQGFKPVRYAWVYLRRSHTSIRTTTDSRGYFEFVLPRGEGREYRLLLKARNYAARVERDYDSCNEYVWWDGKDLIRLPASGDIELGTLQIGAKRNIDFNGHWKETDDGFCWFTTNKGDIEGGSAYFNILETMMLTRRYADANRGDDDGIGRVDVAYPDNGPFGWFGDLLEGTVEVVTLSLADPRYPISEGTPWTNPFFDEIYLPGPNTHTGYRDTGFLDETITHEYTHHLTEAISENDWALSQHTLCSNIDEEFAWFEGFAEYMSFFMLNKYRGDPEHYLSQERARYGFAETPDCPVSQNVEGGVVNVLWDLVDPNASTTNYPNSVYEDFDTAEGSDSMIFKIFDTEMDNIVDAPDICEFVDGDDGWRSRYRAEHPGTDDPILPILEEYNISLSC